MLFKSIFTFAFIGFASVQAAAVPATPVSIKSHEDAVRIATETTDDLTAFLDKSLQAATNAAIDKFCNVVFAKVPFDVAGVLREQVDPLEHSIVLQAAPEIRDDIVHFLDDVLQKKANISTQTLAALARKIEATIVFDSKEAVRDWRDTELQRLMASILKRVGASAKEHPENTEEKVMDRMELLSSSTDAREPMSFNFRKVDGKEPFEVLDSWAPNASPVFVDKSIDAFPQSSFGVRPVTSNVLTSLAVSLVAAIIGAAILGVISYLDIVYSLKPLLDAST